MSRRAWNEEKKENVQIKRTTKNKMLVKSVITERFAKLLPYFELPITVEEFSAIPAHALSKLALPLNEHCLMLELHGTFEATCHHQRNSCTVSIPESLDELCDDAEFLVLKEIPSFNFSVEHIKGCGLDTFISSTHPKYSLRVLRFVLEHRPVVEDLLNNENQAMMYFLERWGYGRFFFFQGSGLSWNWVLNVRFLRLVMSGMVHTGKK